MERENDIRRFLQPQEEWYARALEEVKNGEKVTHWIWFIFPQMRGLGYSSYSWFYGISSLQEAKDYLSHPILGKRLREITQTLLDLRQFYPGIDALAVFGSIDSVKVRSCMTLFDAVSPHDIFSRVLDAYYNGQRDSKTLQLLQAKG